MISFRQALATTFLAASVVLPLSAQAAIVVNEWGEIDVLIPNDQECGDATAYHLEGMVHEKVSTLRNGQFAVNINAMGSFTPVDGPNAGEAAIFRQNIHNVLPIWEEGGDAVHSIGETIRVIGKGQAENFRLKINAHITFINGEVKSFFDVEKVTCR